MEKQVKENGEYRPPEWCINICINSGAPGCIYDCAAERDARYFTARPGLTLKDIAPFPHHTWSVNSKWQERSAIIGLYVGKLVEERTGISEDEEWERLRKELEAASDERLMEMVAKARNESGVVYEAEKENAS